MERLTQTSNKGGVAFTFDLDITCERSEIKKILKVAEKLKNYEDAEEQGLLLRLPCKPGDTIYYVADGKITEKHVIGFLYTNQLYIVTEEFNFNCPAALIGHVLFITRDEAKAKLKEMESSAVEPGKE